ncbi:hypothetical protein W02_42000 [Nitrospira sp. KM1]|uniref:hypothetical protein n=1 Tax=Nitrospira sp. KM1 TaxID=1936990 RepID=UPI0013A76599|nr:hypothetical protein [Nitrospira sp. KM1]BCA57060.1 hypothetical protein W02_42000 [Nitrospira sp. KM1]
MRIRRTTKRSQSLGITQTHRMQGFLAAVPNKRTESDLLSGLPRDYKPEQVTDFMIGIAAPLREEGKLTCEEKDYRTRKLLPGYASNGADIGDTNRCG